MRIRREQAEHFGNRARAGFTAKMQRYLRRSFPAWVEGLDDEELTAWLRAAVARCEGFGVTTEPEAAQLVLLLMVLGLDADRRHPFVAEARDHRGLLPIGKVRAIVAGARAARVERLDEVLVFAEMAGPRPERGEELP